MPLRKMKPKKYKGIYEYYRASDPDKATVAYYISVRESRGAEAKKIKTDAATADEARLTLLQYKTARTGNTPVLKRNMTFTQLATIFFDDSGTMEKKNYKKDKKRFEQHIKPVIGDLRVHNMTNDNMQTLQSQLKSKNIPATWRAEEETAKLSPKTINDIVDLAYRIANWGVKHNKISNKIEKIDKEEVDNIVLRIFTKDEMEEIYSNVEGDTLIFIKLMYHTAQRPQSIIRLQKKHIINNVIIIDGIKKQKSHTLPISSKLGEVLYPWIENLEPDDYIITKKKTPLPYQTIQARINKLFGRLFNQGLSYRKDVKLWASLYTLRHTALSNIYNSTGDIQVTQTIGNHSDSRITQRYVKEDSEIKLNALEGL